MQPQKTRIKSVGTSVPEFVIDQQLADQLMADNFREELSSRSMEVLHQVMRHPSVRTRHFAINDLNELLAVKNEDPDRRNARFNEWAVKLSAEAFKKAMDRAGLSHGDLSALIVNTCTGYLCPGIATYLIERLGLPRSLPVYDLVGSGCGGTVPNLQLADKIVRCTGGAVACISVEISSATFEMENDLGIIVSNAIFGDGAAAAIVTAGEGGLAIEAESSAFYPESREYVRFVYRHGRLHNKLDAQLPKVMRQTAPAFMRELLAKQQLTERDVRYWALHPGGDRILAAIQEELGLTDEALAASRGVLARYGNMSSPSVLFVLDELMQSGMRKDEWCLLAAYGAGMSVHGLLLKQG